MHHHKHAE